MEPVVLDISVGTPCLVEPVGVGNRFKSQFLGWEHDHFCLLRPPRDTTTLDLLYPEKTCIVRYLSCKGVLCGFRTQVQAVIARPQRGLFMNYPQMIETLSVRKQDRVDCFLPASIRSGKGVLEGFIVNISVGGFRFSKREEAGDRTAADLKGALIDCSFSMVAEPVRRFDVPGEVRAVLFQDGKVIIKAAFVELNETAHASVGQFVDQVTEHLTGECEVGEALAPGQEASPNKS